MRPHSVAAQRGWGPASVAGRTAVAVAFAVLLGACSSTPADEDRSATTSPAIAGSTAPNGSSTAGSTTGTTGTTGTGDEQAAARPSPGCGSVEPTHPAGVVEHDSVEVAGVRRAYDVAHPAPPAAREQPAPLVLAFHGFSLNAAILEGLTHLAQKGTGAGSIVVMPEGVGTPPTWQITGTGSDGAFVDALIDRVTATTCVDLDRVFMVGFSAGSAFAIAYTCAHRERIAAIAAVTVEFVLGCSTATSIIAFHGTADESVPYQDGAMGKSLPGVAVRGTELNMGDWAKLAGCGGPTKTPVSERVTHWVFGGCTEGTEVELFSIEGGPHEWPRTMPASDATPASSLEATDEILEFLSRQHR